MFFLSRHFCGVTQVLVSDFSHIEIVTDSADFKKIVTSSFIRDTLGLTSYDTMQKAPLAIGYYVNGREHFINFNPNAGYFKTQKGTVYLIFQSRRPGQGKYLEASLQTLAKDTLIAYDFKTPSFTLTEIIYRKHYNLVQSPINHVIPMLSSYSVASYKNWGLGDSTEVNMQAFIGLDTVKYKRLFHKITSVHVLVSNDELVKLSSVMDVAGYEKKANSFIKNGQPSVYFSMENGRSTFKIQQLNLLLTESLPASSRQFGEITFRIQGNEGSFLFK